ncbi:MAG: hypothetical protein L6Q47_11860 [Ignavibacteriaceae bacterium]|nr:hypothetical protein [Ignavibacteriaceae bacterium]
MKHPVGIYIVSLRICALPILCVIEFCGIESSVKPHLNAAFSPPLIALKKRAVMYIKVKSPGCNPGLFLTKNPELQSKTNS